jgi:hypothetical protein
MRLACVVLTFAITTSIAAQDSLAPRAVSGRVMRAGPAGERPVSGAWAVLHRVGSDRAGALDSARTTADGRYQFRYTPSGVDNAIYFVSASHGGIAYFTPPLKGDAVTGEAAQILVFDTTSAGVSLRVRGKHLVFAASGVDGARSVVEVIELSNDTTVALVAGASNRPTWTTTIPTGARGFRAGQGDVPEQAVSLTDGRVHVFAPFPPGVKQVAFTYSLPPSAFPLSVPVGAESDLFEVLIEDSLGTATGAKLESVGAVSMQGRQMRRFLGRDVSANGVVTVDVPRGSRSTRAPFIAGVVALTGIALSAALVATRRSLTARQPALGTSDTVERLAREIAALDDAFESETPNDAYRERRAALKAELVGALAARDGRA